MSAANASRVRGKDLDRGAPPLTRFLATLETTLSREGRGEGRNALR
jgi:hypothetical protein